MTGENRIYGRLLAALYFLFSFAFYLGFASGAVPSYRDAGDFIATIPQLGIAHPPGYPVYVLLGKLFLGLLPLANAAYRLHALSAVCASLAGVILLLGVRRCLDEWVEGRLALGAKGYAAAIFLGPLLWSVSPAVQALARVDEMYTLSALAASTLLVLCSRLRKRLLFLFFLWGISLVIHPTLILLAPLLVYPWLDENDADTRVFSLVALVGGLSLYAFLWVRASQSPLSNWGDPSHWRNFWRVVTRADYGGLRLHPVESQFEWSAEGVYHQIYFFIRTFTAEWRWVGLFLGCWGLYATVPKGLIQWKRGLVASWILTGPAFFVFSNLPLGEPTTSAILQPYLLLAGVLWVPLVSLGFWDCARRLPSRLAGVCVILILGFSLGWGIHSGVAVSQRNDFYGYDYGRNLLRSLPIGAVLYEPDDPTAFSIRALQVTEGRRPDVVLLNFFRTRWGYESIRKRYPDLLPPGDVPDAQTLQRLFWSYSIKRHPFYVELPQKLNGISYRAEGLVYGVGASPSDASLALAERNFGLYALRGRLSAPDQADFFTKHVIDYYAAAHTNLGLDYAAAGHYSAAIDHYKAALLLDAKLAPALNDWGVTEYALHHDASAAALYRKAIALDPANAGFARNLALAEGQH